MMFGDVDSRPFKSSKPACEPQSRARTRNTTPGGFKAHDVDPCLTERKTAVANYRLGRDQRPVRYNTGGSINILAAKS